MLSADARPSSTRPTKKASASASCRRFWPGRCPCLFSSKRFRWCAASCSSWPPSCCSWPALRVSRTETGAVLHDGGRGDSSGPGRQRVRRLLVVGQVAGSLVLLIVAGLFVRSLRNAQQLNLGFDASHLLNVRLAPHWA